MKHTKLYLLGFIVFLSVVLAACGSQDGGEQSSEESNSEEQSGDSHTVEGENGEVTIPENPETIVAPYLEDSLLALGVTPSAQWSIGDSVLDYLQDDLQDVEKVEWNMPLEQVLSFEPDLLMLNSIDSMEGQLEDYEGIAPTYLFKQEDFEDTRKQLTKVGEILGKSQEAEDRLAAYDQKAEEAKQTLADSVGDETVAVLWIIGDEYFMFEQDRHAGRVVYEDLGLTPSALTEELGEAGEAWNAISLEKLSELETDHLFLISKEDTTGLATLQDSSVYQNLDVVQNDQVYHITDPSNWTNKGIIAFEQTIDEVLEALAE
ncbi:ABC transporter substrate-binding protein [Gracilibacillus phocaeensis]|uniref:ABC transporter substrate-binding protein n=1 Tax=Gracilibacillus phocaeensis TaxID=2042304 RepID=UPI001031412C|nr:ABC transporter substrate-binding protein [Gracilibacillus phocaeensis]